MPTVFSYLIFTLIFISQAHFEDSKHQKGSTGNLNCSIIPLAVLSSLNHDRLAQMKLFTTPFLASNSSTVCGQCLARPIHKIYARPVIGLIENLCLTLHANPMIIIYLNDYNKENHAAPPAYLFFLKLFSSLSYPMLTFNYFHPFYPANFPDLRFFQLAPTYREEARALVSLMERYDWNAFSLIIDPSLPGEEELLSEFSEYNNERRNDKRSSFADRVHLKGQRKFTILSTIRIKSNNPVHIKHQLATMNPETRVIIVHVTSTLASQIVKFASNMSYTGSEYMWIMSSIVLSTYSSGTDPKMSPFENPNRRKVDFYAGTLALYNDVTRDSVVSRFDKHIGPILTNIFAKLLQAHSLEEKRFNVSQKKSQNNQTKVSCNRILIENTRLDSHSLQHIYPELYSLLKEEFKRAHGVFQSDGLAVAGNYSVLNYQYPNREWKKVGEYVNDTLSIADIQWPGGRSKPPPGKPIIYYLRVVTLAEHPFVMLKNPNSDGKCQTGSVICRIGPENSGANHSDPNHYQCCSGFYIDIFNSLKERLKFEFELYQVLDRTWGARNPVTNKWNGLIAELLENRADLTLTSLKVTTERNAAIDFSIPLMETGIGIIVSLRPGAISTTAFLKPYDYRIWVLILLVTLHGVAITVFVFEYFQKRLTMSIREQSEADAKISWSSTFQHIRELIRSGANRNSDLTFFQSVWLSWVILFRAPAKVNNPKSFTSKFMTNVWACFCLAFTASYTANLAAFMITKEIYFELSGINDIRIAAPHTIKPPFRFGTVANGSTDEVIKTNHKSTYSYIKQFMKKNISEGIKALKSGELHAFLYDAVVLDYLSGQDDGCKLRVVGNWYAMTGYGIGFPKQSKFKDMINRELIEMHHSGEIERLRRFWFTGACRSSMDQQSQRSSQKLDTLNFTSAFLLLFGGTLIATIILLCENAYAGFLARSKRLEKEAEDFRKNRAESEQMLPFNQDKERSQREIILEKRVQTLEARLRQLEKHNISKSLPDNQRDLNKEQRNPVLLLPIKNPPFEKRSSLSRDSSSAECSNIPLLLVEQSKTGIFETVV